MISFCDGAAQQRHVSLTAIDVIVKNLYLVTNFYWSTIISPTPTLNPPGSQEESLYSTGLSDCTVTLLFHKKEI